MEAQSTIAQDIKDIKPGIGLGKVKFGMTREQVAQVLGQPTDKESFSYEDEVSESWHFDNLDLSMAFDEMDEWRLVMLSVTNEEYLFLGKTIIGMTKEDMMSEMKSMEVNDLEVEDFSEEEFPNQELISSDALGVNFFLDQGIVVEIQWGPDFIDEDTIKWPELD